jgi:chromosome partitioning protein
MMILTVASFKGGQAKTTTAVHLAAFLCQDKPTVLIYGDPNRSATGWARRKGSDSPGFSGKSLIY